MTTPAEETRAHRFHQAFSAIEQYLRDLTETPENMGFDAVVARAAKRHSLVNAYAEDLDAYRRLRNNIAHRPGTDRLLAVPTEEAVEDIEHLQALITAPPLLGAWLQESGKQGKVYCLAPDQTIVTALEAMRRHGYSRIPIYDGRRFRGLLAPSAITRWLGTVVDDDPLYLRETSISAVLAHQRGACSCVFLATGATLYDAVAAFQHDLSTARPLDAILVTERGTPDERPVGILTHYDLPAIRERLLLD